MVTTNAAVRSHRQPMVEGLKLEIHRLLCSFNACIIVGFLRATLEIKTKNILFCVVSVGQHHSCV